MRILLINPGFSSHHPPLGLGYISSYLKKYIGRPVEVRLFDENTDNDILKIISEFKPELIGISIVTPVFKRAVSLCHQIKTVTKSPIIAGGVHITAVPECIMTAPFDVGVIGEGEATFLELVQYFLQTGEVKNSNIAGIVYKKDNSLVYTHPRQLIKDLDTIPPPDRSLFNMDYLKHGNIGYNLYARGTSMFTSRGCPYHTCNFCSSELMWGKNVRFFSPQYVVNEMQSIVDEFGLNFIIFLDDNFTTNRRWLEELCTLIKERGLDKRIRLDCESIAAYMDDKKADILKKMGVIRVEFGFESGSPRILRILKAGKANIEHNERAIDICHRHGLMVVGNMICGYIDETPQEFEESLNWFRAKSIDYIAVHIYTPFPRTPGWNECIARGLIKPNQVDWTMFVPGRSAHNLIVNVISSKDELKQRLNTTMKEFYCRNKVIVVDNNLSLKEKLKLYSLASKGHKRSVIKLMWNRSRTMPWSRYVIGLIYPGHFKQIFIRLLSRFPKLYSFSLRIKHDCLIPALGNVRKKFGSVLK